MPIIADIIIIAVLILALVIGVKRGLLGAIAGIVSVVAAFFGAALSASFLTPAVEQWLQPILMQKLEKLTGKPISPQAVLQLTTEELLAIGLKQQKIDYVQSLAQAVACGTIDMSKFAEITDSQITFVWLSSNNPN